MLQYPQYHKRFKTIYLKVYFSIQLKSYFAHLIFSMQFKFQILDLKVNGYQLLTQSEFMTEYLKNVWKKKSLQSLPIALKCFWIPLKLDFKVFSLAICYIFSSFLDKFCYFSLYAYDSLMDDAFPKKRGYIRPNKKIILEEKYWRGQDFQYCTLAKTRSKQLWY